MRWVSPLLLLWITGCSDSNPPADCSDSGTQLGGVYAVDAQSLTPICDFGSGLYSERLTSLSPRSGSVSPCDGLREFPYIDVEDRGIFRLEVFAPGYQTTSTTIRIFADGCGAQAVSPSGPQNGQPGLTGYVTVALEPE